LPTGWQTLPASWQSLRLSNKLPAVSFLIFNNQYSIINVQY